MFTSFTPCACARPMTQAMQECTVGSCIISSTFGVVLLLVWHKKIRSRLLTPTVGVVNRHEVAIATDSLSIKATNILSPPIAPLTLAGLASHAAPPTKRWGWLMAPRISRGGGLIEKSRAMPPRLRPIWHREIRWLVTRLVKRMKSFQSTLIIYIKHYIPF